MIYLLFPGSPGASDFPDKDCNFMRHGIERGAVERHRNDTDSQQEELGATAVMEAYGIDTYG